MSKKTVRDGEFLAAEKAANQLPEAVKARVLDALYYEDPAVDVVPVAALVLEPAFQMRVAISDDQVAEYTSVMADPLPDERGLVSAQRFPALQAHEIGGVIYVTDGIHRVLAARAAGVTDLLVEVKRGSTRRDALLAACKANAEPRALSRTSADKRKALDAFFENHFDDGLTDTAIARLLGVSRTSVGNKIRALKAAAAEALREKMAPAPLRVDDAGPAPLDFDNKPEVVRSDRQMTSHTPIGEPKPTPDDDDDAPPPASSDPMWKRAAGTYESLLREYARLAGELARVEADMLELAGANFNRFDRSQLEGALLVGGAGSTSKVLVGLRAAARMLPIETCPDCRGAGCAACHQGGYMAAGEAGLKAVLARVRS